MTPHAHLYEPTERVRWLVAGWIALSLEPYTNRDRLAQIESKIGQVVCDEARDMLEEFSERRR